MPTPNHDDLFALYVEFLAEGSAPMRRVAVWELGRLGDPRAGAHLMRAVREDPDWECRHYSVMALANAGGAEEAWELRALAAGSYLSPHADGPAGPVPEGLVSHLSEDMEYSARCCAGETPRPSAAPDRHGQWWWRGDEPDRTG